MATQVTAATEIANDTVQLKRVYQATAEEVYQAWINPDALNKWFGPASHTSKVEKMDLREGGGYQIRMIPVVDDHSCTGDASEDSVCAGQYIKIIPNKTLVMTFNWIEGGEDMGETLLSIDINTTDNGTEVSLTHERIPSSDLCKAHQDGWESTLVCLDEFINH